MAIKPTRIPLILLPGSLTGKAMWRAQAAALADIADVQIIETAEHDNVAAMAEHVLHEAPAGRFALAGFSLGGFIAFEVLRQARERVSHLALLDTSARPDHPDNAPRRLANIAALATEPERVLDQFVELTKGSNTPPHVVDEVRASMYRMGARHYAGQQRAMIGRMDARLLLESVRCPALVLCGAEDRATPPEHSREIVAAIPRAQYVELAGIGHMTPLEAPAHVSAALRAWLQTDVHDYQESEPA